MGFTGYLLIFTLLLIVAAVKVIMGAIWQRRWKKSVFIIIALLAFLALEYGGLMFLITSM